MSTATTTSLPHARQDALAQYFQEMDRGTLLSPEEEGELAALLRAQDESLWVQLLSIASLVPEFARVIENDLPPTKKVNLRSLRAAATKDSRSSTKKSHDSLVRAAKRAAVLLREADPDQAVFSALLELLQAEAETNSTLKQAIAKTEALHKIANRTRNKFVESNLGLVVSVARRYRFSEMGIGDLIQEGNLGLLKGVARFDERRGFRFSTYATWWIRHSIGRAVADKSRTVRVPVHVTETKQKLGKTAQELSLQLGRDPTREEIAEASGIPLKKVEKTMQRATSPAISLDEVISEDSDRKRMEVFTTDTSESVFETMAHRALSERATKAMDSLAPIEIEILHRRFGLEGKTATTLQDIANSIGKSRERIRQIQEKALFKLRNQLVAESAV